MLRSTNPVVKLIVCAFCNCVSVRVGCHEALKMSMQLGILNSSLLNIKVIRQTYLYNCILYTFDICNIVPMKIQKL